MHKQANERTNKQTKKQANKWATEQMNKQQMSKLTNEKTNEPTRELTNPRAIKWKELTKEWMNEKVSFFNFNIFSSLDKALQAVHFEEKISPGRLCGNKQIFRIGLWSVEELWHFLKLTEK